MQTLPDCQPHQPTAHYAPALRADSDLFGRPSPEKLRPNVRAVERNGEKKRERLRSRSNSLGRRQITSRLTKDTRNAEARARREAKAEKRRQRDRDTKQWVEEKTKAPPPTILQAKEEETNFRHSGWKQRRELVLAAMQKAGFSDRRVEAFTNCGANAWVERYTDTDGGFKVHCQFCHDRFCIPCGRAHALNIADNLRQKIADETYLHIVLTLKHNQAPLAEQVDRLLRSFKTLRGKKSWKQRTDGGAFFLQVTVGRDDLWHPHLHILTRGKWIPKQELSNTWLSITGDSDNVGVSLVRDKESAVREVTRYASRPMDEDTCTDPDRLAELMRALTGRHLCSTFGKWRKFKLTAKPVIPQRPTESIGRLVDIIAKANAGDVFSKHVLDVLTRRLTPKTGPPPVQHHQ